MEPRLADVPGVAQAVADRLGGRGHRLDEPHGRHLAEVADHRHQRHALQQRLPDLGVVEVLGGDALAGQARLADQGDHARAVGRPGLVHRREQPGQRGRDVGVRRHRVAPLDLARAEGLAAADHPAVDRLARRVGRGDVRQPQQVAVRPAAAALVLGDLVGQVVGGLALVPRGDGLAQRPSPATDALDGLGELEQVRPGAADPRQGLEGRLVAHAGRDRQGEDRRIVPRRATRVADRDDRPDRPRRVGVQAADHRLRVLDREGPLGRVVRAPLAAQDQEPLEPLPVVDGEGVPAGRVRDHRQARDRLGLRRLAGAEVLEDRERHGTPPCCGGHSSTGRGHQRSAIREGDESHRDRTRRGPVTGVEPAETDNQSASARLAPVKGERIGKPPGRETRLGPGRHGPSREDSVNKGMHQGPTRVPDDNPETPAHRAAGAGFEPATTSLEG